MPNISLKQLEAFVRIAKDGSFRKAAERLNTTQPNISVRISKLEEQLGKALMERDAGSVRLTHTGQTLLPEAKAVLQALENFKIIAQNSKLFEGGLRLGVTETIALSWLSQFLSDYSAQYPHINVELIVDLSANLTKGLSDHAIDLALQSGPFEHVLQNASPLGKVPYIWVASPSLEIKASSLKKCEFGKFPILTHSKNTLPYKQLEQHFSAEADTVRLVPSSSLAACLQMTIKGIGIACLPVSIVKEALENKILIKINYNWTPSPLVFESRYIDTLYTPHHITEASKIAAKVAKVYKA